MPKKNTWQLADEAMALMDRTPDGVVVDADTILKDLLDDADYEITGLAKEVVQIWKDSVDKGKIEQLFCLFTGCEFQDWLDRCVRETTRAGNGTGTEAGQ